MSARKPIVKSIKRARVISAVVSQAEAITPRKGGDKEHKTQKSLIKWVNVMKFNHAELDLLFAVPNGGWRSKASAGKIKAEGAKAGVPDLVLPVARHGYHGLFIELKTEAGVLSSKQEIWINKLQGEGYLCAVPFGLNEAIGVLESYLGIDGRKFEEERFTITKRRKKD